VIRLIFYQCFRLQPQCRGKFKQSVAISLFFWFQVKSVMLKPPLVVIILPRNLYCVLDSDLAKTCLNQLILLDRDNWKLLFRFMIGKSKWYVGWVLSNELGKDIKQTIGKIFLSEAHSITDFKSKYRFSLILKRCNLGNHGKLGWIQ